VCVCVYAASSHAVAKGLGVEVQVLGVRLYGLGSSAGFSEFMHMCDMADA